ncbi:MAG TPA: TMEM14 family protein [Patescibacteria group bacterium]|nr:TMEM14 family protein [Patescibacteria group bacterium]
MLAWVLVVFGMLTIAGGILDFFRTKRISSLAIPGVIGFIIAGCGALVNTMNTDIPRYVAMALAIYIAYMFIMRFRRKESHFTDAIMIVFSIVTIGLLFFV